MSLFFRISTIAEIYINIKQTDIFIFLKKLVYQCSGEFSDHGKEILFLAASDQS